jgi:hypothetical protein
MNEKLTFDDARQTALSADDLQPLTKLPRTMVLVDPEHNGEANDG